MTYLSQPFVWTITNCSWSLYFCLITHWFQMIELCYLSSGKRGTLVLLPPTFIHTFVSNFHKIFFSYKSKFQHSAVKYLWMIAKISDQQMKSKWNVLLAWRKVCRGITLLELKKVLRSHGHLTFLVSLIVCVELIIYLTQSIIQIIRFTVILEWTTIFAKVFITVLLDQKRI